MECKDNREEDRARWWQVLIETLWNVKIDGMELFYYHKTVLIETLWNVKIP